MTIQLPSLAHLANAHVDEISRYSDSISLSEVIIAGSRPTHRISRPRNQVVILREIYHEKFEAFIKQQKRLLPTMLSCLYPTNNISSIHVPNYLEKYRFLTSRNGAFKNPIKGLNSKIETEIREYRDIINLQHNNNGSRKIPRERELNHLEQTTTNLTYYFPTSHVDRDDNSPFMICKKIKTNDRIASKILDYMIRSSRENPGKNFRKSLNLEEGIIRDIFGLQIVTLNLEGAITIKEYLNTYPDIEVLINNKERPMDDYFSDHTSEYQAFHVDVTWNPAYRRSFLFFNQHIDAIEAIIINLPDFIKSNFGSHSYWKRINSQKKGIVSKKIVKGKLQIEKFTEEELRWRDEIKQRILEIIET